MTIGSGLSARQPITIRDTIRIWGPEAEQYLQGQLSQDVAAITKGDTAWSLLLQPTGKMLALLRIQRISAQEFLTDVDAGHADTVLARLRRFQLRTKVHFEVTDDAIADPPTWPGIDDPSDERQRIRALLPRMGAEITERTIPAECGTRMINLAVSFSKGCYTGQELVARIDSRGSNVPRPVRVLRADTVVELGAEVGFEGVPIGRVTSAAAEFALAPLKRSANVGAKVLLGEVPATIVEPTGS